MEPISFGKKINPNCTPGAITRQSFSGDGKSAYVPVAGWWPDKGQGLQSPQGTGEDIKLEKAIEPLREVYKRLTK